MLTQTNEEEKPSSAVQGCVGTLKMGLRIETLLVTVAGVMAITTAITSYRNTHAHTRQLLVVVESMDNDVVGWCSISLAVIGVFNIAVGIFKSLHRYSLSFNQYVGIVVSTLVANFCIGMVLTDHKAKVLQHLEPSMLKQLKELQTTRERFGVGFSVADAWDFMQMKLMCCGVNGFKDYLDMGLTTSPAEKEKVIPVTCCAMKTSSTVENPVPDNVKQCQLDAKLTVFNSIFLHTQGCYNPLSRWIVRMINKMVAMVFCMICLQALGVFYLSWLGYRRSVSIQPFHR